MTGESGYPPKFRRKVLDLVESGRPTAEVAKALGISTHSISTGRRQDRIDQGLLPGLSNHEHSELLAARRRMRSWRPNWRSVAVPPSC